MNPLMSFIPAVLDVTKRAGGGLMELLNLGATKAAANPKISAGLAAVVGLYIKPEYVVMTGTYVMKFGRFLATIGAAMGG